MTSPFHARAEADRFSVPAVTAVGLGALLIFALATWLTYRGMVRETELVAPLGSAPIPSRVDQSEIGLVNQRLFELQDRAQRKRDEQQRRLSSYGWVDRKRGVIHVPVDQVMREMTEPVPR